MKRYCCLLFLPIILWMDADAQFSRYLVHFKHKGASSFNLSNPAPYLSPRAIARRTRYQLTIDSTDLPVPASYISQLAAIPGVSVLNVSRWLNAASISISDVNALTAIQALPFVQAVNGVAARDAQPRAGKFREDITSDPGTSPRMMDVKGDHFNYGTASYNEIHLHNGEFLHNIGLRGQGMQIALLDGGYYNYTSLKAFDSMNLNNQVISTWDFVARETSVVEDHPHGMQCLSTIAANIPGLFIGKAPKAAFHLFRTEDVSSEYPIEEFNWACGAERADSAGADLISSSLGYGYDFGPPVADYPYSDLNGDITMSARAADLAARKGLMVFNAAGNSGNDYWHYITTPADGDSVVAVGAVNTSGIPGGFSSYGPSADGRTKPDVASVGAPAMVQTTGNTVGFAGGTSFACPNMAGLASCLWQGFPEFNNMRIVRALKEAGNTYTTPNHRTGYGIPNMKAAFATLLSEFASFSIHTNACDVTLNWSSKDMSAMRYDIERRAPGDIAYVRVGTVNPSAGNILSNHSYQFKHDLPSNSTGVFSYRIRQVIDTSAAGLASVYFTLPDLTLTTPCLVITDDKVTVVPNPVSGDAVLVIETPIAIERLSILVYDMKGSLLIRQNGSKAAGRTPVDLRTRSLASGRYIIKVYDGNREVGTTEMLKL